MSFPRPISVLSLMSVLAVTGTTLLVLPPDPALAASTDEMLSGPLQNSKKSTYVGIRESGDWVDSNPRPVTVRYPAVGETGVLEVNGTCVPLTQSPTNAGLVGIPTGDGSRCLTFRSELTTEGFFTFRVETPGAATNGRYLGDGNAGSALDLLSPTPIVLFAIPEEPSGTVALTGRTEDTNDDGRIGAGDDVVWSTSTENTGNVRLRDLSLVLADGATVGCDRPDVNAGDTLDCEARRPLTQAEVDAGTASTTLTGSGLTPRGTTVALGSAEASVAIVGDLELTGSVTSDLVASAVAGDVVHYTIRAENTGTVGLTGLSVRSDRDGAAECDTSDLTAGGSTTCRVERRLSQADVDAGSVAFAADLVATAADGREASTRVELEQSLDQESAATVGTVSDAGASVTAGQTIHYTTTVTNTGTVTLGSLASTVSIGRATACASGSIAPGASTTCSAEYTVTQADVDAGFVAQHVEVTAAAPGGSPGRIGTGDVRDVAIAAPLLDATVSTDAADVPAVGDVVTATVHVTNTGNVTLTDLAVDPSTGAAVSCADTTLAPGASTDCVVARAPLTQADIDAGVLDFTADVLATSPSGDRSVRGSVRASDPVPASPAASATLTSDIGTAPVVGQTVTWTTTVRNTGNVTLSGLVVTTPDGAATCAVTDLAPGASTTCTSSATLTQADVDRGSVDREAVVSAAAPGAAVTELTRAASSDVIGAAPALTATTVSDATEDTGLGDQVTWTTTVTNSGTVTMSAVELAGGSCDAVLLAPGAETTCTSTQVLTQADVDAGILRFAGVVSATSPDGVHAERAKPTAEAAIAQHPALGATSTSDADSQPSVGDTVTVTVTAENTGDVTIRDLALRPDRGTAATCDPAPVAPGGRVDCLVTTVVTQADVDAGGFLVTTAVLGTTPTESGAQLATTEVRVGIPADPSTTLALAVGSHDPLDVGAVLTVDATVTNTGNVTLEDLALDVADDQEAVCADGPLAPGATVTCTITTTVTQEHVDAGTIDVHATGTATAPGGSRVAIPAAEISVPIDADPRASLVLTAEAQGDLAVGTAVRFTATVTNHGNVTLDALTTSRLAAFGGAVAERERGDGGVPTCDTDVLAPGASTACSYDRTVTQADLDHGSLRETVVAAASTPSDEQLEIAPASVTVDVPRTVEGATALSADTDGPVAAGDRVTLTTTIRNTGSVTLSDVRASEADTDAQQCIADDLAPGAETTCVSVRTVTAEDVERGAFRAHVLVGATDPQGADVELPEAELSLATQTPETPEELAFTGVIGLSVAAVAALALLVLGVGTNLLARRRRATGTDAD